MAEGRPDELGHRELTPGHSHLPRLQSGVDGFCSLNEWALHLEFSGLGSQKGVSGGRGKSLLTAGRGMCEQVYEILRAAGDTDSMVDLLTAGLIHQSIWHLFSPEMVFLCGLSLCCGAYDRT